MTGSSFDTMPAYRRRIRIEPAAGAVIAMLEDDIHCMAVILRHDGERVLAVEPDTPRMPWTTCPGAAAQLVATFQGLPLSEVTARREKKANCTHLHDLAVLAVSHAADEAPVTYDIVATDPVDGERRLEIRRDGRVIHRWLERNGILVEPAEVAGMTVIAMRDWIGSLSGLDQEAARLLQWGSLVAHGRTMPIEQQSRASDLPPNCYTFQPERAAVAERVGERFDFSTIERGPLEGMGERMRAHL